MRIMKISLEAVVFAAALSACGGGSGYTQLMEVQEGAIDDLCECYEVVGAESKEACTEMFADDSTDAEQECVTAVMDDNKAEVAEAIECMTEIFQGVADCIAAVDACDEAAIVDCMESVEDSDCPEPPEAVSTEIDACYE